VTRLGSRSLQERVEFKRGALAKVVEMGRKELVGRCTFAQRSA
jgi:hypothetical protein